MSNNNLALNGLFGFLAGYGIRAGFDAFNGKVILERYEETGQIPKKKPLGISLFLAMVFGSFGLFYISPRTAIPFAMMELFMLPFFFGVVNFLFRPIPIFMALVATLSYNRMIIHLFGRYGGDKT